MRLIHTAIIGILFFTGCTKVLSVRTDEQAWQEFESEIKSSRKPAAMESEALRDALAQVPVRTLLLKCGNQVSPELCYRSAITLHFDEVYRKAAGKESRDLTDYKKAQKQFLTERSYEVVLEQVTRFHQSILSGIELRAREYAEALFEDCDHERKSEKSIEHFDLVALGPNEIPKGTYSCLVEKTRENEARLLKDTEDRLGLTISTEEAKIWILSHQVERIYFSTIADQTNKRAKEEVKRFGIEKPEVLKEFDVHESEELAVKKWAPILRERYPYSPVEQWVLSYRRERL